MEIVGQYTLYVVYVQIFITLKDSLSLKAVSFNLHIGQPFLLRRGPCHRCEGHWGLDSSRSVSVLSSTQ
jgi:hypothetical protein